MDRFVGGTQSIGKFNYVVCPTKLSVRYKQCIRNKPSDTRHVLRGETGKKEIQGYGLLPITTFCQGSTQMDDLVAKQETIKGNGISSIQDLNTSRARKLSSHGDLAYCSARRYFGENIYNVSVLRELNLQPGWKWTGEKLIHSLCQGKQGNEGIQGYGSLSITTLCRGIGSWGTDSIDFAMRAGSCWSFFLVFGAQSLIAHYLFLIEGTDGGQVIKGMDCFNLYNQPLQGCHRTDPAE